MHPIPGNPQLAAEKRSLRKRILAARARMSADQRRTACARIHTLLFALPAFQRATGVHAFLSFGDEVDTEPIFQACLERGKRTYVPVQQPERGRLDCCPWRPGDPLTAGPFNVREPPPKARTPVDLRDIDLVIVPGVAFDAQGHRLGYGKAYYDEFLARLLAAHGDGKTRSGQPAGLPALVAVAFFVQVVPQVPTEPWDLSVHQVLTENGPLIPEFPRP